MPSCSNNIGEVMKFVTLARRGLIIKTMDEVYGNRSPSMLDMSNVKTPSIGHILDAVGVGKERMCCRMHLMGATRPEAE